MAILSPSAEKLFGDLQKLQDTMAKLHANRGGNDSKLAGNIRVLDQVVKETKAYCAQAGSSYTTSNPKAT